MDRVKQIYVVKPETEETKKPKQRVAAYCRVSTDSEDQVNSFVTQVKYYNEFVRKQKDMILVDVYADEGITGTCVNKRDEFMRMIKDCRAGKIDRIYVKSVSRFARNSLECIDYIRELKSCGVSVFFENDGIDSKTMNHELILYIKSAFAQSESIAASRRVKRSNQMRMETGDFAFVNAPFGYKIEDDTLIPIPEEAEIVRRIFQYYLAGMGFGRIAQELNNNDAIGKPWGKERVRYILSNEKYIGDTLHQKTYTPTELPFRNRKNRGEVDQYYVSNSHEAILDKDVFYAVKEMLEKNLILNEEKAPVKRHKFTGKIFCSDCTWAYKMHVQNGITYWACSQNGTAGRRCVTHPMSEEIVERTFRNFYNKLKQHEGEILKSTYNRLIELKASITKSRSEVIAIDEELLALGERLTYLSRLLETRTLDKEVFNVRAADIKKKIADLRVKRRKLLADDEEEQCIEELRQTIAFMDEAPKAIIEYDHKLFNALIKRVLVEENRLVFELKCGIALREKIAWN